MRKDERQSEILELVQQKKCSTVAELSQAVFASEATVRRDLNLLHKQGKLIKHFFFKTLISFFRKQYFRCFYSKKKSSRLLLEVRGWFYYRELSAACQANAVV